MNQEQEQPWIVVGKPKKKKIKKQGRTDEKSKNNGKVVWQISRQIYTPDNQSIKNYLSSTSFSFNKNLLKEKLEELISVNPKISNIHIECLGLGNFTEHKKPHFQYLFLVHILVPLCRKLVKKVEVNSYDPVFTEKCLQKLKQIGSTKADNVPEEQPQKLIILYMPHCQRFLYERYCEVYVSGKVFVVGNSIKEYCERCQLVGEDVPQCFKLRIQQKETKIWDYEESFNDTYCYFI